MRVCECSSCAERESRRFWRIIDRSWTLDEQALLEKFADAGIINPSLVGRINQYGTK